MMNKEPDWQSDLDIYFKYINKMLFSVCLQFDEALVPVHFCVVVYTLREATTATKKPKWVSPTKKYKQNWVIF